jgi:hypothetical protein
LLLRGGEGFEPTFVYKIEPLQDVDKDNLRFMFGVQGTRLSLEGLRFQMDATGKSQDGFTVIALDGAELHATNCNFTQSNKTVTTGVELRGASKVALQNSLFAGFARGIDALPSADQEVSMENCLITGPIGIQAKSPSHDSASLSVRLNRNTFHVAEVVNLGGMTGGTDFSAEANIFHTSTFSTSLKPSASSPAPRKWDGRHNVYSLTRWVSVAGQSLRDVRDLETWRKFWKTKEEGSIARAVRFAKAQQLGPFRHDANPNDWRVTVDRLSPDLGPDVQLGCDVYLVGAGQPYFQFRESIAYDAWQRAFAKAGNGKDDK